MRPPEAAKLLDSFLAGKSTTPLKVLILRNDQNVYTGSVNCHTYGTNTQCNQPETAINHLMFGLTDADGQGYIVSISCREAFRWNHCDYPPEGSTDYPVVLEKQKDKSYKIFIAVYTKLGSDKSKVSTWKVENISLFIPDTSK